MIYLDHAATTPLDERAREAMLPWLDCANPSSQHASGREARMAIDAAREKVAASLGCLPGEVTFTSSGTEACVTAILGTARAAPDSSRRRILMGTAEHHAVLHCQRQLAELGFSVELVPATHAGAMDIAELNLTDEVLLVCAMHANNETGAITDVDAIGERCREKGVMFFCDAVQTFKKLDLPDAELVAVSGHKINGPKGVGALRVRAGTKIEPLMSGGGQEREMRGGTENVAAIVGFGVACEMGCTVPNEPADVFREEVRRLIPQAVISCADVALLRTHVHLRIPGVSAEVALINLDRLGIAASSGAACSSGSVEPSHVLLSAGLSESAAVEGLRFTFGRGNTIGEAKQAATALATAVNVVLDT